MAAGVAAAAAATAAVATRHRNERADHDHGVERPAPLACGVYSHILVEPFCPVLVQVRSFFSSLSFLFVRRAAWGCVRVVGRGYCVAAVPRVFGRCCAGCGVRVGMWRRLPRWVPQCVGGLCVLLLLAGGLAVGGCEAADALGRFCVATLARGTVRAHALLLGASRAVRAASFPRCCSSSAGSSDVRRHRREAPVLAFLSSRRTPTCNTARPRHRVRPRSRLHHRAHLNSTHTTETA